MSVTPLPALPARYRDVQYVAEGAFGHVYRATGEDGRALAVKVLSSAWLGDADAIWRFTGEFRRLASLASPAFPQAVEEGLTADGRPFFAMTFLPGTPLNEQTALPPAQARQILAGVATALRHLHGLGLVHGDLKAANVLRGGDGQVYVLDVGSAAPVGQRRESIEGTPEYMAPEVLRQLDVAPEADWYALGVLGFALLAGRLPFTAGPGGPSTLVRSQLFDAPPALPDGPLAAAVLALLAKDPAERAARLPEVFKALQLPELEAEAAVLRGGYLARTAVTQAWARLSAADGPVAVLLEGPAGAGKSRALDALRLEARLAGKAWVSAACAGAGEAPGAVARVLVRQVLAAAHVPPSEHVAAWLAGELPADWLDLEPRARKLSLFGALGEAWAGAAGSLGGLVIGLDDWHTADALSRELVEHLAHAPAGDRTRWCLAGESLGMPGAEAIALAEWSAADVAELLELRLGAPAPASLLEALDAVSARRPGLVNALVEHWFATGALTGRPWRFTQPAGLDAADPWARLWEEGLARLSPEALELARLMGVAYEAGPLPAPLLGRALGLADDALQATIDGLLSAGVLAQSAAGLRLAVGARAAALAEGLPRRRELAASLARLTLDREPDAAGAPADAALAELPLPALVLASRLAARGDDDELAVALAAMAARRALEHLALADALRTLAEARDRLTDAVPAAPRLALFLSGGEAARLADRTEEAGGDLAEALKLAEAAGDDAAAGQALLGLAKIRQLRGRYDEALAFAGRAEQVAERAGRPSLAARAAVLQARVELFTTGHAAAVVSCARAVALAEKAPAMRSAALNLQGVLLIQDDPSTRTEALAMIREAIALSEGVGDPVGMAAALENLGNAYVSLGELREGRDTFARDAEHCRSYGIGTENLSADMNLAHVMAALGEVDAALHLGQDVAARAEAGGRTFIRAVGRACYGQAAWRGGLVAEAVAALDDALALARSIENRYAEAYIRLDRLEAWLNLGELERAREEATAADALVGSMSLADLAAPLALLRAELARVEGELAAAATQARPYAGRDSQAVALAAHNVLGRTAMDAGQPAEARGHFEASLGIARAWGAPWHLAAASLQLALAASDPAEAAAYAREAIASGQHPYACAGAACVLANLGPLDAPARAALERLAGLLDPLDEATAERLLAAQGLPDRRALEGLRKRAAASVPPSVARFGDLAAWHEAIVATRDEGACHQALLSALMSMIGAERGYLLCYERGRLLEAVTVGVDYAEEVAQGFSATIAEEALFSGEPIYLVNAAADERWQASASVQALGLKTVVALPLATAGQIIGVVYMDREAVEPLLTPEDLTGLMLLATTAAARVAAFRREAELVADLAFERRIGDAAIAAMADPRGALLDAALAVTGAQRAFWLAREGTSWRALAQRDTQGTPPPFEPHLISQSVLAQATEEREAVCLIETDKPEGWVPGTSLLSLGIRMVWCLPVGPEAREALYLDTAKLDALDPRALLGRLDSLLTRFAEALAPTRVT